jgi:hypothetical protein
MGVEIKFTDKQFPVSPVFIEFLYNFFHEHQLDTKWHDQVSEELLSRQDEVREAATAFAGQVLDHPKGRQVIYRAYEFLSAILTGDVNLISRFQDRYQFICVVGCPRHGGSYLTKELYKSLGMVPSRVPEVIAHDGFPDASPFDLHETYNSYTTLMQHMSEFMAMIELYFGNSRMFDNRVPVPKKATKAAYHGSFFRHILGPETEYIVTLRHPIASAISTYEKSTGMTADGKFNVRGNIEEWARRDVAFISGLTNDEIFSRDYFDTYLEYWIDYHCNMASTGLLASSKVTAIAYGEERYMKFVKDLYQRFENKGEPEHFQVFDKRDRHPEWNKKAEKGITHVAATWKLANKKFPIDEIMEQW